MTEFTQAVIKALKKVPKSKVVTYSQLAKLAGNPRAVRGVVWILNSQSETKGLPWYRVINAKGKISFPVLSESWIRQKKLLELEGVEVSEYGEIDLKEYQWAK